MNRFALRFLLPVSVLAAVALVLVAGARATGAPEPSVQEPRTPAPLIDPSTSTAVTAALDTAVFAGGCFWGIEAVFEHLQGVTSSVSGYSGGSVQAPSYEQVSTGRTGHAESVRVVYEPAVISYGKLLQVFFSVAHDPTELNRQGPDVGTQYRSAIFYRSAAQKAIAEQYIAQLTAEKVFRRPIVTEVAPFGMFFEAEAYHQDYLLHHPNELYIVINDAPKVANLKKQFPDLFRSSLPAEGT